MKMYVDVSAIKENMKKVQNYVGSSVVVMPVAKANAYGAEIEIAGKAFRDCKIIGVANVNEAVRMQKVCPNSIVFVMYQPAISEIPIVIENDFHISVNEADFLKTLNLQTKKQIKVHINVDTGHGVLGVPKEQIKEFCAAVKKLKNITIVGAFSHFTFDENTTNEAIEYSNNQIIEYNSIINNIENEFGTIEYKHMCNSSGIEFVDGYFNVVRSGRLVYGYSEGITLNNEIKVKPSMKYVAEIITIKKFKKGMTLGYNKAHSFSKDSIVATIALGYSNSFPRTLIGKGSVVVNKQTAPIIHIAMNLACVDITNITGKVSLNDEVAIFDNEIITLEQLANWCGTPNYIILTQLGRGVEHIEI